MVRDKKLYETLGVAVDANENDIKKAYKKGALKYHPDKNKDNEDAAEKFKDLSQAYEILSDTEKRKTYDLHGLDYILRGGASEPEPSSSEPRSSRSQTPRFQREDSYPFTSSGSSRTPGSSGHARNYSFSGSFSHTPSDPFRTFDTFMKRHASARMEDDFGFSDRGSPMGGGPGHHSMPGMGSPLPDQGIHGSPYPRSSRHRTERRDHPRPEREPSGRFEDRDKTRGLSDRERDYGDLKVNGKFSTARSHTSGRTHKGSPVAEKPMDLTLEEMFRGVNKKVRVKRKTFDEDGKAQNVDKVVYLVAKPGVKAGDYIKLPEAGDETEDGRVPDLYVIAGEKAHDRFKREGDDLITSIDIDLKDALLGWTNTVTNIEEHKLPISHPGPTPPTWTETFPGHGMRKGKGKEDRGNLVVKINIKFPTTLTTEQKNKIKDAF